MFHNAVFPRPTSTFDSISGHEIWNVPHLLLLVLLIGCCSMLICEPLKGCLVRLQFQGQVMWYHVIEHNKVAVHANPLTLGAATNSWILHRKVTTATLPCARAISRDWLITSYFIKTCHWNFWWRSSCQQCARHTVSHSNQTVRNRTWKAWRFTSIQIKIVDSYTPMPFYKRHLGECLRHSPRRGKNF